MKKNIINFKKGQIIFKEGDTTREMYIITSGRVDIVKSTGENGNVILATLCEGATIGEMSMISKRPRSASAIAKEDVSACLITQQIFKQSSTGITPWAMSIAQVLVERLRRMNNIIEENTEIDEYMDMGTLENNCIQDFSFIHNKNENPYIIYLRGYFLENDICELNNYIQEEIVNEKYNMLQLDFSEVIDIDNKAIDFITTLKNELSKKQVDLIIQNVQLIESKISNNKVFQDIIQTLSPPERRVKKDEILIKQNNKTKRMYLIKEGRFRIQQDNNSNIVILAELGAGEIVGEMTLIAGDRRSASVIALTPGIVYEFNASDILNNKYHIPQWFLRIIQQLIIRIRMTNEKVLEMIEEKKLKASDVPDDLDYVPQKDQSGMFKLKGRLIAENKNKLEDKFMALINRGYTSMIIDFSNVKTMDKELIPVFHTIASTLKKINGKFYCINTNEKVKKLFMQSTSVTEELIITFL
jgi:CRP-like cAMP-binding protein